VDGGCFPPRPIIETKTKIDEADIRNGDRYRQSRLLLPRRFSSAAVAPVAPDALLVARKAV
jgi:hypothetical protein